MSSPNPNQQYPFGGFAGQPYQQPTTQYPDPRYPQSYPVQYPYPNQHPSAPVDYIQPHYGTSAPAPFIAELPAPLPPAPPTSTSQQQLTEDELLARKLQQMEVDEARRRSSSNLSHRPSQYCLGAPSSPEVAQGHLRSHSHSVSSTVPYGPDSFGPPPNQPTPSLLPEVVSGPRPISTFGVPTMISPTASPIPHPTAHLPPPPSSPASLSSYLELHRQVPYPPQWILRPVTSTLYASFGHAPKSDWLDGPVSREWRTVRFVDSARKPTPPSYSFSFKSSGGSLRDPRFSWTMTPPPMKEKSSKLHHTTWAYNLRIDLDSGIRKSELLTPPKGKDLITTYTHAPNYDTLRFVGPEGRLYMWVAHAPLNSTNGSRYDILRHALFASTYGQHDPLYGEIVADHTYWDGFVDYNEVHTSVSCEGCGATPINGLRWKCKSCVNHNICETCRLSNTSFQSKCSFTLVNLPDETLYIRSSAIDPALIVATLQILKDWELHTLRIQKKRDPQGFEVSENAARKSSLGRIRYWRSTDFEGKGPLADGEVHGTVVKMREASNAVGEIAGAVADVGQALGGDGGDAGVDSGGGGGGGDGGGGGGGGGGC